MLIWFQSELSIRELQKRQDLGEHSLSMTRLCFTTSETTSVAEFGPLRPRDVNTWAKSSQEHHIDSLGSTSPLPLCFDERECTAFHLSDAQEFESLVRVLEQHFPL